MKSLKVCRICHHFFSKKNLPVGLATHLYWLSLALKKEKVKQSILAGDSDSESIEGMPVFRYGKVKPFEILNSGKAVYNRLAELKKQGIDFGLLHYHNPSYFKLHDFRKELGIPIVQTNHGSPSEAFASINWLDFRSIKETMYYYYSAMASAKKADALVCVSPGVRDDLIKRFGLSQKKVFAITPGINEKIFRPLKNAEKKFDIVCVGRFTGGKRHVDLINAVRILKQKLPDINAAFIGKYPTDPCYNQVVSEIKRQGLEESIKVLDSVPQEKLALIYNQSRVLVLPSLHESAPKVTLEAMACGCPTIVTDILGNKGISINGKTGFVVKTKSPGQIAEKAGILLRNERLSGQISRFNSERMRKNFTWEKIAKQYKELYSSLA